MTYRISFSRRAEAYLERLDRRSQERMYRSIRLLGEEPRGHGTKQLKGVEGRTLRVGGWRIVYFVDDEQQTVRIDLIAPRGQVYRRL